MHAYHLAAVNVFPEPSLALRSRDPPETAAVNISQSTADTVSQIGRMPPAGRHRLPGLSYAHVLLF